MQERASLIEHITPVALLKALTPEAKEAINKSCLGRDLVGIWSFPFRIGRESRVRVVDGELVVSERHRMGREHIPTNDLYLIDLGKELQISREHLTIMKDDDAFKVIDRDSVCGTVIDAELIGGHEVGGNKRLADRGKIRIGSDTSPFLFEFIVLK